MKYRSPSRPWTTGAGILVERGWNRVARIHATSVIDTVAVDMNLLGELLSPLLSLKEDIIWEAMFLNERSRRSIHHRSL